MALSSTPGTNPFEGAKPCEGAEEEQQQQQQQQQEEEEEAGEEGFVDPEHSYRAAEEGREGDSFSLYPSRADEALKTCKRRPGTAAATQRTPFGRRHARLIADLCYGVQRCNSAMNSHTNRQAADSGG